MTLVSAEREVERAKPVPAMAVAAKNERREAFMSRFPMPGSDFAQSPQQQFSNRSLASTPADFKRLTIVRPASGRLIWRRGSNIPVAITPGVRSGDRDGGAI